MFRNSNVNKTVRFFLVSKDRKIITFKIPKCKKKKLSLTLLCFIMLVEKYGWIIQKSLFAYDNY